MQTAILSARRGPTRPPSGGLAASTPRPPGAATLRNREARPRHPEDDPSRDRPPAGGDPIRRHIDVDPGRPPDLPGQHAMRETPYAPQTKADGRRPTAGDWKPS